MQRDWEAERAIHVASMQRLLDVAKEDNRNFSEQEQRSFDEHMADIKKIDKQIDAAPAERPNTRPVEGRSIFDSLVADGFVQRLFSQGSARTDIAKANILRAIGSTQASSPAPGFTVQPQNLGLVTTYHGVVYRLLSALSHVPVDGNAVFYSRVHYGEVGSPSVSTNNARKTQELLAKSESILATDDVTVTIPTWAHYVKSSKQVMADLTGLRALVENLLLTGLLDKMDAGVFADLTTSGNFTAFTPASAIIADEIASLATQMLMAGATDVKVALNPATLLAMRTAKASGSGVYLGLPDVPASLVASASVPTGHLLAWSSGGAAWAAREDASVVAGLDSDDFTKNKVTLLCEARGATMVFDPKFVRYGASNT